MTENDTPHLFYHCSGRDLPDYAKKSFDSLIVKDGRVLLRGFAFETMAKFLGIPRTDLKGATVLPAFADAHVHFLQTGLMLFGCRFDKAETLSDVMAILREYSRHTDDSWILGWNLDETKLREGRLPTMAELDLVSSNRRVWISRIDLHSAILNSAAMAWSRNFFPEARLDKDRLHGNPYYVLANRLIGELSGETKKASLEKARSLCLEKGIATVHALEGGEGIPDADVEMVAGFLKEPGFHGLLYHQSENPALAKKNGWNRLGGCLFVDGSFGSRTAALTEPYADDPGNTGCLYRSRDQLEALARTCFREGLQLAVHAIGNAGVGAATEAFQTIRKILGKAPLPNRIEHFELPNNHALRQAKEAEALISVQPAFEVLWGGENGMYAQRLGRSRAGQTNPFRTMLNYGLPLAGGSDSPVTPIDPFLGLEGFLNHPTAEERIDLNSALAAFILEPHRFGGEGDTRGKLETGYHADFVCLDQDPFMVPASRIRNLKVEKFYIDGNEVTHA